MHSCDDHEKNGGVWLGFNQGIDVTGIDLIKIRRCLSPELFLPDSI